MFKIYCKNDDYSLKIKLLFESILAKYNFIISKNNYQYIISIGGDGTFIDAISAELDNLDTIVFIPINTGHLGFFTEKISDFEKIILNIINNKENVDSYTLLEAKMASGQKYYAFNEFFLHTLSQTIKIDYYINNEHLQTLRGSGIIISTPQGSTAISKANNGAVIYPNNHTFQISEVGSINNNSYRTLNSSIILPPNAKFKICIDNPKFTQMNFDTRYNVDVESVIEFTLSNKKVRSIHLKKNTFTKRIKDGFIK